MADWIIIVDDIQTQDMSDDDFDTLCDYELNEWSTEIFDAAKDDIKENLTEDILLWAIKRVTGQ